MRGLKRLDATDLLTSNPFSSWSATQRGGGSATEGRGFEPLRACAQRFSRPPPYQLGLALQGTQPPKVRLHSDSVLSHVCPHLCPRIRAPWRCACKLAVPLGPRHRAARLFHHTEG